MPIPAVSGTLQSPGDTLLAALGNVGQGGEPDVAAILSLTGTFQGAVVAVEGVPIGQPLTPGNPPTPLSPSQWAAVAEVGLINDQLVGSPVGPLASNGQAGSGFTYAVDPTKFVLLRLRLVSIQGGAILGGIATTPFPVAAGLVQVVTGTVNVGQQGQQPKAGSIPVVLASDQYQADPNRPPQPAGGPGPLAPVPVVDREVLMQLQLLNEKITEHLQFTQALLSSP